MLLIEIAPVVALLAVTVVLTVEARPVMRYMQATADALHRPEVYVEGVLGAPRVEDAPRRGGGGMSRLVPYPVLTAALILMWLLLNRFSPGHLVLGTAVALVAGKSMSALQPAKPRLRRWDLIPQLVGIVLLDIVRSNVAVAGLILTGGRHGRRRSGFVEIPLELRDPTALAILAVIITATPGTAWMQYDARRDAVLLHVFDLVDEADWIDSDQGPLRAPAAGDLRMSAAILATAVCDRAARPRHRHGAGGGADDPRTARPGPGAGARHALRELHAAARHPRHAHRQRVLLRGGADHRHARLRGHRGAGEVPDARRGDRMNGAAEVPLWAAIPVAAFLLVGAGLTLIGSFGLLRLPRFYDRIHAPTLGTSWGTAGIVLASMIYFSVVGGRPVLHELLIGVFVTVTTPVTLMLLGRAAVFRDRAEGRPEVPPRRPVTAEEPRDGGH